MTMMRAALSPFRASPHVRGAPVNSQANNRTIEEPFGFRNKNCRSKEVY
jgi:hypothetical protein